MPEPMFHILVRYTSGHRATLNKRSRNNRSQSKESQSKESQSKESQSKGWQRFGDRTPLRKDIASLLATNLRSQGAEVKLQPIPSPS